jgi:hypothetical protein
MIVFIPETVSTDFIYFAPNLQKASFTSARFIVNSIY